VCVCAAAAVRELLTAAVRELIATTHFPVASQPFFYLVCFEVYLVLIG